MRVFDVTKRETLLFKARSKMWLWEHAYDHAWEAEESLRDDLLGFMGKHSIGIIELREYALKKAENHTMRGFNVLERLIIKSGIT